MSPLTHLAVASGNDLLRNQWFYQHSNLASLQTVVSRADRDCLDLLCACSMLLLIALAFHRAAAARHRRRQPHPSHQGENEMMKRRHLLAG